MTAEVVPLASALAGALPAGTRVVVDLTDATVDNDIVAGLRSAARAVEATGGELVLAAPGPTAATVLEMARGHRRFAIHATVAEACAVQEEGRA